MQLNLPILDQLADSKNILIAGIGGGFDVFIGLPIYFTLRALGKNVHLANYSFSEFDLLKMVCTPEVLIDGQLIGARSPIRPPLLYFPEGYLAQWFKEVRGEDITVWMFAKTGVLPLIESYHKLVEHLQIDTMILVDGGVDSIMHGDESGSGTVVEDSISLAAISVLDVPVKIQVCLGFGTEVEEQVCHHHALQNIATLAKDGAFLGSCALTPQMEAFQLFEAAARYTWEQPNHPKSHISTRIIPAVNGEFGNFHMYPDGYDTPVLISPLMGLYWFFDANAVIEHNQLIPLLMETFTTREAFWLVGNYIKAKTLRQRKNIPY
jgi:hypothetical protein